jgi:hypothetical protein
MIGYKKLMDSNIMIFIVAENFFFLIMTQYTIM